MRGTADAENEKTKTDRCQTCTGKIERTHGARRIRQRLHADTHRNQPKGNVDREQPRPGSQRQDTGSDRRSQREGGRDDERVMAEPTPEEAVWVDVADQG